jgi:hypothetical protein
MLSPSPYRLLLAAVLAGAALTGCNDSSPAAAEAPAPSPTPVAVPVPTPRALGCGLPPGGGSGEDCPREEPSFMAEVEQAIDRTIAEHPEMVNTQRARGCGNCYQVLDTHNFPEEVGRNLEKMGFCTKYDGEELAVKNVNRFNDQYDLLLAEGFIRRETNGAYRSTCYPAWY